MRLQSSPQSWNTLLRYRSRVNSDGAYGPRASPLQFGAMPRFGSPSRQLPAIWWPVSPWPYIARLNTPPPARPRAFSGGVGRPSAGAVRVVEREPGLVQPHLQDTRLERDLQAPTGEN